MRRKNDILWKGVIEEIFDDLLLFVFPGSSEVFDMDRGFEFLDKELSEMYPEPDKESTTQLVDKLVKVFRKDGKEEWILVHVEVQGHMDRKFPERMFRYYCRIYDRYRKPITAVAIFTGQDGKKIPDHYKHCFMGIELMYRYNTLYVTDFDESFLLISDNPFAFVILASKKALLAGKVPELELVYQKLLIANLLYENNALTKKKIESILSFLNNYILFEDDEMNRIFDKQLDQITGKKNTMGVIELLAELKVEEAEEKARKNIEDIVRRLLANTEFSVEKIASLAGVPVSQVETIKGN